jgi:hypothetical protein
MLMFLKISVMEERKEFCSKAGSCTAIVCCPLALSEAREGPTEEHVEAEGRLHRMKAEWRLNWGLSSGLKKGG